MMKGKVFVVILLVCVVNIAHAEPAVWYVHPDSALNSIQTALDACAANDIVLVGPGTYTENIVWPNTYGIHLISELGSAMTIIDGGNIGSVVKITSGVDSATVIRGFTIQNGSEYGSGGGIYCGSSSPNLTNLIISGNHAGNHGGGIYCDNSSPSLTNVTITGNHVWELDVSGHGGGIYCSNSNPSLTNVTITGNSASGSGWVRVSSGGGIYCDNSSPSLTNVTISGNTVDPGDGGGIYCRYSSPSLTNVTISGNTASDGGGIYCVDSSTLIFDAVNRCNIFLNFACSGCDLYAFDCPTIDVIVDTFTVLQPDDYFAYPIDNFTFDILNAKVEQVNQDLYVSPDGSNDNSGLTPDDPLLTVSYALAKILADSSNPLTIHLSNGTYSPSQTGERFPLNCRSYVSSLGEDEASTILDGEGLSGILFCENDNNFSIENMTIQNSNASGIRCYSSSPSLENVTISGNTRHGIFCSENSSPSLTNVTISGNTTGPYGAGGGILCDSSSPSLTNVTISGNTAHYGGGIHCKSSSNPSLTNVTISGNTADYGGGIHCKSSSNPSLTNVTISGNTAGPYGGGILCNSSSPSLTNVTISENGATYGGGIYCDWNSSPSLANVIISGNGATDGGGIWCSWFSNPSLTNVTISGNTAGRDGGGILCWNSSPILMNCILWDDTPQEIYIYESGSVTATYSDIQGWWPGTGNINEDPVFVSGPLSDYHLSLNSPCIDAGNPDPQYNDPEDPLNPGYALWPALGTVRNDMGVYGGPGTEGWVGIEEHEPSQSITTFLQISPNPFRDRVNIKFGMEHSAEVIELKIYDATGRLVKEFGHTANQRFNQVIWAGDDNYGNKLPSGVYFLKFTAGDYSATEKLLLIR